MKLIFLLLFSFSILVSQPVVQVSKTEFMVLGDNSRKIVDLSGKDFIVVTLRERNSGGSIYAVDKNGLVWVYAVISSGAQGHRTPTGIFRVLRKARRHMSSKYPDPSGVNNMDYSLFFTPQGHALHLGNTNAMSHGCIHVDGGIITDIFYSVDINTPVVVIRGYYDPDISKGDPFLSLF
jgi:lipoprotein-anchoring transpeptidase ErfK/SrfK